MMMKSNQDSQLMGLGQWQGVEVKIREEYDEVADMRAMLAAMERFVSEVPEHAFPKGTSKKQL